MQLNRVRDLTYMLTMDTPKNLELDQVAWQQYPSTESGFDYRSSAQDLTQLPNLNKLVTSISEQQHCLLETYLWADAYFRTSLWAGTTLEELKRNTSPFIELCKDKPGFYTGIHVDHRRAVAVGMLFLNPQNLASQNTIFYMNKEGAAPWAMATGWGNGWYSANYHQSWHSGSNMSNEDRYSIKFGLYLKMGS